MGAPGGKTLAAMVGFAAAMVAGWNALIWAQGSTADGTAAASAELAQQIEGSLRNDPDLRDNHIEVRVKNDVATLKGVVDSDVERARAVRLAAVGGIKVVDDQLEVRSATVGQEVTDASVTTKVKTQLVANTTLRHADIGVTTNNGVVTLRGAVASDDVRRLAVDLARHTGGVKRVDDELSVGAKPAAVH